MSKQSKQKENKSLRLKNQVKTANNSASNSQRQSSSGRNLKSKLSTQPYKGARDFYPEDMRIRNYIFDAWRLVCKRYGFEEYDFPFLEPWKIYAAKTGEEIVKKQLYYFEDRGGRKIAIRPEKTPSVARMVAAKINELTPPIKWFNIGNCWRYEKPQRGRGREFFQFDCDIFGVEDIVADVEVFSIPVEVMLQLGAKKEMFEIKISNRRLAEFYMKDIVKLEGGISKPDSQMYKVGKIVDNKSKITEKEFVKQLEDVGLNPKQILQLQNFINSDTTFLEKYREDSYGADEILTFFELMKVKGYAEYFKYSPEIMRGLDYYSGNVIEQFDLDPKNNRSMFGGGRYDNLVDVFSSKKVPGVGFAMGDVTLLEFLKGWKLLPTLSTETKVLVTIFDESTRNKSFEITEKLREAGINTELYLETKKLDKQFKYADRKGLPYVIVAGPEEIENETVQLKDMKTKKQKELSLDEVIRKLKKSVMSL